MSIQANAQLNNPMPGLLQRILSGILLGIFVGSIIVCLTTRPLLNWSYATVDYGPNDLLHSKVVFAGFTAPDLHALLVFATCLMPLIGFVVQLKPWLPKLATLRSCVVLALLTAGSAWFAWHSLGVYWSETLWMHHS